MAKCTTLFQTCPAFNEHQFLDVAEVIETPLDVLFDVVECYDCRRVRPISDATCLYGFELNYLAVVARHPKFDNFLSNSFARKDAADEVRRTITNALRAPVFEDICSSIANFYTAPNATKPLTLWDGAMLIRNYCFGGGFTDWINGLVLTGGWYINTRVPKVIHYGMTDKRDLEELVHTSCDPYPVWPGGKEGAVWKLVCAINRVRDFLKSSFGMHPELEVGDRSNVAKLLVAYKGVIDKCFRDERPQEFRLFPHLYREVPVRSILSERSKVVSLERKNAVPLIAALSGQMSFKRKAEDRGPEGMFEPNPKPFKWSTSPSRTSSTTSTVLDEPGTQKNA